MTTKHFGYEAAPNITAIFYVIDAANSGNSLIRILSDDADVFMLLVCWVYTHILSCSSVSKEILLYKTQNGSLQQEFCDCRNYNVK